MAHVIATVDRLGRVKLDPQGYSGPACKDATAPAERAFRGAVKDDTERPEMQETRIDQDQSSEQRISL